MEDTVHGNMSAMAAASSGNGISASMPSQDSVTPGSQVPEKRRRASAKKYKSFEDAKKFAHELNLRSRKEWREYVKGKRTDMAAKPDDIPAHPDGIYKTKGWQGWRHWLGTEKPTKESLN